MLTWKDNIKELVNGLDKVQLSLKAAKLKAMQELTSIAFKTQVDTYFKDSKNNGNMYLPNDGDISRYTRRKSLSKASYFSSKMIFNRSGELSGNLLGASDAAKSDLKYGNDDVSFEITPDSITIRAVSDKFGKLERAKTSGGKKSARNTTKKTWSRIVRLWAKTFEKLYGSK